MYAQRLFQVLWKETSHCLPSHSSKASLIFAIAWFLEAFSFKTAMWWCIFSPSWCLSFATTIQTQSKSFLIRSSISFGCTFRLSPFSDWDRVRRINFLMCFLVMGTFSFWNSRRSSSLAFFRFCWLSQVFFERKENRFSRVFIWQGMVEKKRKSDCLLCL